MASSRPRLPGSGDDLTIRRPPLSRSNPSTATYNPQHQATSLVPSDYYSLQEANSTEGYDLEIFDPKPDEKFICPICLMVLREPVQTLCGHRFCEACIRRWTREKHNCPVCNEECPSSRLFKDNFALREVKSLRVKCLNAKIGCKVLKELGQLDDHIHECPFVLVDCPQGCSRRVYRNKLQSHLKQDCPRRDVTCPHCLKDDVPFSELTDHEMKCPEVEVQCKSCQKKYKRGMISDHRSVCVEEKIQCPFEKLGCPHEFRRADEREHLNSSVVDHLSLLCNLMSSTQRLHSTPRHAVSSQAQSYSSQPKTDAGFFSGGDTLLSSLSLATGNNPQLHSISLEDSGVLYSSQGINVSDQRHGGGRALQLSSTEDHSSTEDGGRAQTFPLQKRTPRELQQESSLQKLRTQVQNHEKLIADQERIIQRQETVIARMDSQLRDFEGRNCNGTYIWRIKDYKRRKQDAVSGKTIVHHSPGFYTSFYGYKMCIRINLNGVESGTGTHLSLFIHLMQGEFDEILKWPFQGTITISVLDQRGIVEERRDIVETLNAKPELAAFLRPTTKRNHKGFGYIEFAPLSQIDNGYYVKHDVMMVKAVVQPSQHLI